MNCLASVSAEVNDSKQESFVRLEKRRSDAIISRFRNPYRHRFSQDLNKQPKVLIVSANNNLVPFVGMSGNVVLFCGNVPSVPVSFKTTTKGIDPENVYFFCPPQQTLTQYKLKWTIFNEAQKVFARAIVDIVGTGSLTCKWNKIETEEVVNWNITVRLEDFEDLSPWSYIWEQTDDKFLSVPLIQSSWIPFPITTLSNIRISLDKPRMSSVVLTAYVVKNQVCDLKNITGLQVLLDSGMKMTAEFKTRPYDAQPVIDIDEPIIIRGGIQSGTHILFLLVEVAHNSVLKVGALSLDKPGTHELVGCLYSLKDMPKKYLNNDKAHKNALKCILSCPHSTLGDEYATLESVDESFHCEKEIEGLLVPITDKLTQRFTKGSLCAWIRLMSLVKQATRDQELMPWIFNVFYPNKRLIEDMNMAIVDAYKSIHPSLHHVAVQVAPLLIDMLAIVVVDHNVELRSAMNSLQIMAELVAREGTAIVIREFSIGLLLVSSHLRTEDLLQFASTFLMNLLARGQNAIVFTLILDFLAPLCQSSVFVAGCAITATRNRNNDAPHSLFNEITSRLFLAVSWSCLEDCTSCVNLVTSLTRTLESLPDDTRLDAVQMFFPLVPLLLTNLKGILSAAAHELIRFVLFALSHIDSQKALLFFVGLGDMSQREVIAGFMDIYSHAGHNQHIACQSILTFLVKIASELENCLSLVIAFLGTIMKEDTDERSASLVVELGTKIIEYYPLHREFIVVLIDSCRYISSDSFSISQILLTRYFYQDFATNGSIAKLSLEFLIVLTSRLLIIPVDHLNKYDKLLDQVADSMEKSNNLAFITSLREQIQSAKIIISLVEKQRTLNVPPEVKCHNCMRIADQYRQFPTLRLEWLRECVRINQEAGSHISAFVSQLHVVALMVAARNNSNSNKGRRTYDYDHHLPIVQPLRFSDYMECDVQKDLEFMPELLSELNGNYQGVDIALDDFQSELQKAVELGMKIRAYYTVRSLLSLQLRTCYHVRNFKDCSVICNQISQLYNRMYIGWQPYSFVLVEIRRENMASITRQVYCLEKGQNCVNELEKFERFSGLKVKQCQNHTGNCTCDGVCIVPLEPVEPQVRHSEEHEHCWSRFRTLLSLSEISKSDQQIVIELQTKDPLPHYRMAVETTTYEYKTIAKLDFVKEKLFFAIKSLDQIRSEFEPWFEYDENYSHPGITVDVLFGMQQNKFITALDDLIKGDNSMFRCLMELKEKNPDEAKQLTQELLDHLEKCMSVFRRSSHETPNLSSIAAQIPIYDEAIDTLCKSFSLPCMSKFIYQSKTNPMKQMPFELGFGN